MDVAAFPLAAATLVATGALVATTLRLRGSAFLLAVYILVGPR